MKKNIAMQATLIPFRWKGLYVFQKAGLPNHVYTSAARIAIQKTTPHLVSGTLAMTFISDVRAPAF